MIWDKQDSHEDAYPDEIAALRHQARQVDMPPGLLARVQAQEHRLESVWAAQTTAAWADPTGPDATSLERPLFLQWLRNGFSRSSISWGPVLAVGLLLSFSLHIWDFYHDHNPVSPPTAPVMRGGLQPETVLATLISQGLQHEQQGETAQAISVYQQAIDQVALPLNQLAWLYQTQGEAAQGLPLAQLAVQLRPDKATFWDTLAVIQCKMGDGAKAVTQMETAARLDPQAFQAKFTRFQQGLCH